MTTQERYKHFLHYFTTHFPEPATELHYSNPYELLVSVVLSAQCTDKRINITTPDLFKEFPTPEHLARASFDELFPYIKSISYPNNKTKHLIKMAGMLVERYNSQIPASVEELQKLPGVGRKTAHVIASVLYNLPVMPVDTHVFRVSKRIGLAAQNASTPLEVEKQLVKYIPEKHIPKASHWLILHGRYVCVARKPKCEVCGLKGFCRYYEKR